MKAAVAYFLIGFIGMLFITSCCAFVAERITSHPYDLKVILAPRDAQLGPSDAGPTQKE